MASFNDIIGSIEQGIYIESNRSWSIDDYRNKFQFGCEYARLIENDKLKKILKNPNYRGITNQFWRSLCQVGDTSTLEVYGLPDCGKGEPNQAVRVGHASPAAMAALVVRNWIVSLESPLLELERQSRWSDYWDDPLRLFLG